MTRRRTYLAVGGLCVYFLINFIIAFWSNPHFPGLLLAGERSIGTWVSGILLAVSATISLILGIKRSAAWFALAGFFALLTLDERFMFHERMKEKIIFSSGGMASRWIYELPVIFAAGVGVLIACILWRHLARIGRLLLVAATFFGCLSVVMDVLTVGVLWEDSFKLVAELAIACALLMEVTIERTTVKT